MIWLWFWLRVGGRAGAHDLGQLFLGCGLAHTQGKPPPQHIPSVGISQFQSRPCSSEGPLGNTQLTPLLVTGETGPQRRVVDLPEVTQLTRQTGLRSPESSSWRKQTWAGYSPDPSPSSFPCPLSLWMPHFHPACSNGQPGSSGPRPLLHGTLQLHVGPRHGWPLQGGLEGEAPGRGACEGTGSRAAHPTPRRPNATLQTVDPECPI